MNTEPPEFRVAGSGDRVTISEGAEVLVEIACSRNRFHYQPRVFRLGFQLQGDRAADALRACIVPVLAELRSLTHDARPLLLRASVPAAGELPGILREAGFIELRRVYEPVLQLEALAPDDLPGPTVPGITFLPLSEALDLVSSEELMRLFQQVYARTSRLDPATPEHVGQAEWEAVFMADPDLYQEATICAFADGTPVELASIFRGQDQASFELGPFGVDETRLHLHQEITLGILNCSLGVLRQAGATLLTTELDSDDPWVLYTLADLPFKPVLSLISFAFVPAW